MGMARLLADHHDSKLDVLMVAQKDAQPEETVTVSVGVPGPIDPASPPVIHLWAVDDGILLPTNFRTPDPGKHFFAPRKSVVTTADVFADLIPDLERPGSMEHIGAGEDEEEAEALRRNPVTVKQREPAVVWNAYAPVNSNGWAIWNIKSPDAVGRLRLMAVAVDQDRYGSADQDLTLTAPLLVEANWPRFVAPGDRFDVPVKLFNELPESIYADLAIDIEGPLEVARDERHERIAVEPGTPTTVWFSATATGSGQVSVRVSASAASAESGLLRAKSEAVFASRPPRPPHVESSLVRLRPDESITIDPPTHFVPETVRTTVDISSQPSVELLSAFEAVVDYPYGCVEQTTSRLYVLLHAQRLFERSLPEDIRTRSIPDMINSGIERLATMQTRGGGLAYWPGGAEPHLWGSAYAGGFLAEARSAGYRVDESFLDELIEFLENALRPGGYSADDPSTRAFICRTLAEWDKPPLGWMTQLGERADQLDLEGRVHLAASWLAAGRKDLALPLIGNGDIQHNPRTWTGERITSPLRQDALLLAFGCDASPEQAWLGPLAQQVRDARRHGRWGNTLENATALVALSKYQAKLSDHVEFTGELLVGDQNANVFDHTEPFFCKFNGLNKPLTMRMSGEGVAYARVTHEGLPADDSVTPYDRNLLVRRRWTNANGEMIDPAKVRVGDLIHVEVTLQARSPSNDDVVANIAIVDALPGGIEVENPRLDTSAQTYDDASDRPDRVEFLDDRVLLFASGWDEPRRFRYTLRATTAGAFVLPPIQASSMYDNSFASLHGGGRMEIQR